MRAASTPTTRAAAQAAARLVAAHAAAALLGHARHDHARRPALRRRVGAAALRNKGTRAHEHTSWEKRNRIALGAPIKNAVWVLCRDGP